MLSKHNNGLCTCMVYHYILYIFCLITMFIECDILPHAILKRQSPHIFTVTCTAAELPGSQCASFFTGKQLVLQLKACNNTVSGILLEDKAGSSDKSIIMVPPSIYWTFL